MNDSPDRLNALHSIKVRLVIVTPTGFLQEAHANPRRPEKGILPSMFRPIDKALPMVSAMDVGHIAASLLREDRMGRRIVELHGPADYSPDDAAHALSLLLDRPIEAIAATDADWSSNMLDKGFPKITVDAFVEMFADFNSGLIVFEKSHEKLHGQVSLHDALSAVLKLSRDH